MSIILQRTMVTNMLIRGNFQGISIENNRTNEDLVDAAGDAITLMAEIPNVETYIALYGVETVKSSPTIIDPEPEINDGVYPADVTDIQNGLSPGNNVLNITIALLSIVIVFVALFMFRLRR